MGNPTQGVGTKVGREGYSHVGGSSAARYQSLSATRKSSVHEEDGSSIVSAVTLREIDHINKC